MGNLQGDYKSGNWNRSFRTVPPKCTVYDYADKADFSKWY